MIHGLKEESKDLQLQAGGFIPGRQDARKYLYHGKNLRNVQR